MPGGLLVDAPPERARPWRPRAGGRGLPDRRCRAARSDRARAPRRAGLGLSRSAGVRRSGSRRRSRPNAWEDGMRAAIEGAVRCIAEPVEPGALVAARRRGARPGRAADRRAAAAGPAHALDAARALRGARRSLRRRRCSPGRCISPGSSTRPARRALRARVAERRAAPAPDPHDEAARALAARGRRRRRAPPRPPARDEPRQRLRRAAAHRAPARRARHGRAAAARRRRRASSTRTGHHEGDRPSRRSRVPVTRVSWSRARAAPTRWRCSRSPARGISTSSRCTSTTDCAPGPITRRAVVLRHRGPPGCRRPGRPGRDRLPGQSRSACP